MSPTLAGFIAWAQTAMGITTDILPADSLFFVWAYNVAFEIVDTNWAGISPNIYMLMVYNLGGSNLINFAQDGPDAPIFKNGQPFFEYYRTKFNILGEVTGVINSASDQGTSSGLTIPAALQNLTLADLQYLKDSWGRTYLQFAQRQGSQWGVS
jgi:hypothetical protein